MPINYQQIHVRIKEIGAGARERKKTLDERRTKARDLLTDLRVGIGLPALEGGLRQSGRRQHPLRATR